MPDTLKGITVLDLTQNIAGPFCTQLLGDFGAEVIKVERPGSGDDARKWIPPAWAGVGTAFLAVNRNKKSVAIDLNTEAGRAAILRLAERCDVLVHSTRPGSLDKRGLGYEALRAVNPKLVYCGISAFGEKGPLAGDPGYDPLIQAFTGIMSVTGHPDRPPARVGVSIIDMGTGLWAFTGILSALYRRRDTGAGALVSTSLMETGVNWMSIFIAHYLGAEHVGQRMGDVTPMTSPYESFATRDGAVLITAANDNLFGNVCKALGLPDLPTDPRFNSNSQRVTNRPALHDLLEAKTRALSSAECVALLRKTGAPCSTINTVDSVVTDPQVAAMAMIKSLPSAHYPNYRVVDIPVSVDGEKASLNAAPPALGAHTDDILRWAGYSDEEIRNGKAQNAFG